MKKIFVSVVSCLLASGCGMTWDNGGREEFNIHCMARDYMIGEIDGATVNMQATCDCIVTVAEDTYASYIDLLANETDFFEHYLQPCAVYEEE